VTQSKEKWVKCGSRLVLIGCDITETQLKADLALFDGNLEDKEYLVTGDLGQYRIRLPKQAINLSGRARAYNVVFNQA
jgi:hypothetical protein